MQTTNNVDISTIENVFIEKFYKTYPDFDSFEFLSMMSFFLKKHKIDFIIQDFEINFLRNYDYTIKTFLDFQEITLKYIKNHPTKSDNFSLFVCIMDELSKYFSNHKEIEQKSPTEWLERKQVLFNNIAVIINDEIIKYKNSILEQNKNKILDPVQQSFNIQNNSKISLSPTKGIMMLNKDPYGFFVEKILNISSVNEWEENIGMKLYGTIIHNLMQKFSFVCKNIKNYHDITEKLFLNVANQTMIDNNIEINSFLHSKLEQISKIAIKLEQNAKKNNREVICEKTFSIIYNNIVIEARVDRLEIDHLNKSIYIYDYKTGNLPKESEEKNGKKTQLSILAILIKKHYQNSYSIQQMAYISLSGKQESEYYSNINCEIIPSIEQNLFKIIDFYFKNGSPIITKMEHIKPQIGYSFYNETEIDYLSRQSKFY